LAGRGFSSFCLVSFPFCRSWMMSPPGCMLPPSLK
jgi:hypothetical protein